MVSYSIGGGTNSKLTSPGPILSQKSKLPVLCSIAICNIVGVAKDLITKLSHRLCSLSIICEPVSNARVPIRTI